MPAQRPRYRTRRANRPLSEAPEVTPPPPHAPEATDVPDAPDTTASPEGKPAPQKSMYDSLEQEMASLLNCPPSKP